MSQPPGGLPSEFDLIGRHFRPLAGPGALDLEDDAAVLMPPPGRDLVMAADAMVAGVHYLPDDPADGVARKLLRVNLSDLAAMGAEPLGYLLTVSAPSGTPDAWFAGFAAGLAADQAEFGIFLLGGDTTSTPGPITLSLTIVGHVAPGMAIRRRGAQPGDEVWVTGTIGDGALGLAVSLGRLDRFHRISARAAIVCRAPRLGLPLAGGGLGGHRCVGWFAAGSRPSLPAGRLRRGDRGRAGAALRRRTSGRCGLVAGLPRRRR